MCMSGARAGVRLQVQIRPRAAHDRVVGRQGDVVKVHVQAPPVAGAANAALVDLLAEVLGVPRRTIRIVHGASARHKLVEIQTADPDLCWRRLEQAFKAFKARIDKRPVCD